MRDFVSHIAPSVISGLFFGAVSANIYIAHLITLGIQDYFIRKSSDREKDDGTDLGNMLGLSTFFYLPAEFIGYAIGKLIFANPALKPTRILGSAYLVR